jgi:hypothetical protein
MGSAAMAATAVLARCWHKPFPPDCGDFRRLTCQTPADVHQLQRIGLAYARLCAWDGTANAVDGEPRLRRFDSRSPGDQA